MNLETKKIKSPFKPDSNYMSDLAARVQSKVGIEKKEVFRKDKSVKIPSNRKEALQLTVEFGFPLTTEKTIDEPKVEKVITAIEEPFKEVVETSSTNDEVVESKPVFESFPYSGIELRKSSLPVIEEKSELVEELIDVKETIEEVIHNSEIDVVEEIEYDSNELDLLHEEMEKKQQTVATIEAQKNDNLKTAASTQTQPNSISEESSWSIPWASIFGAAASVVAVAAAWFVWNIIQKPMAIDDWADQNVVSTKVIKKPTVAIPQKEEITKEEFQAPSLDTDLGLVYDLIVEDDIPMHKNIDFQQLSEQGRISSVELEKEGLMVLELEDVIFDEIVLAP